MSMIIQDSPALTAKTLQDKLESLYLRRRNTIEPHKDIRPAYRSVLEKLGNPHQKLSPVIHVAGTNGKGSVIACMRAILESAGYNVHCYTSPHLVRFNERIVLAGQEIENDYLEKLLDRILIVEEKPLDFFEITTAVAFTAFSENPADILLLETGLGGRLDCTNVIEAPLCTVITSVSYDHMEVLGDHLSDIAYEKAGIFKENRPCIIGRQDSTDVINILRRCARQLHCPVFQCGQEWDLSGEKEGFVFNRQHCSAERYPLPSLKGAHQIDNAGLAVAVLKNVQAITVTAQDIESGLRSAKWPGRLQKLDGYNVPENWEVWLDSGHNESAGQVLGAQAAFWQEQDGKPLHIVVSMARRKDVCGFLKQLTPHISSFTAVPLSETSIGMSPEEMCRIAGECGIDKMSVALSYEQGIDGIINENGSGKSGRILVTGSVYLAGRVISDRENPIVP